MSSVLSEQLPSSSRSSMQRITEQPLDPNDGEKLNDFLTALITVAKFVVPDRDFQYEERMIREYGVNSKAMYNAYASDQKLQGKNPPAYENSPYFYDLPAELSRLDREKMQYDLTMSNYKKAKFELNDLYLIVRGIASLHPLGRKALLIYDIVETSMNLWSAAAEHHLRPDFSARIESLNELMDYMENENTRLNDHRILNGQSPIVWENSDLYKYLIAMRATLGKQKEYYDSVAGAGNYTYSDIMLMVESLRGEIDDSMQDDDGDEDGDNGNGGGGGGGGGGG
ncbi:MAG: hypothetical protein LIQ31_08155, partial [Planctomycetes bacterium]|nr:hypothetical protein [Planctomycetota bacterium]